MSQRFVNRAALASLGLAVTAALLTAAITCGLAAVLLQRAEDRRLHDAAVVLGSELKEPGAQARLAEIVEEEHAETTHMGLAFALFDVSGRRLAGDSRITFLPPGACALLTGDFRACSTDAGLIVVAGGAHASTVQLLLAALLASLLVALGAFFVSRPLAKSVVSPLLQLQTRLARLDAATITHVELGPLSGVAEVDALRTTIEVLLGRVDEALTQASRFASDAAHELRTPLSTIQGELDLLLQEAPTPAAVNRLRSTVARLSLLVERLLVLATPGSGTAATELVSLRDVLEDTVAGLAPADRERVALELNGDVSLRGDSALLSSMVSNAISNALKFGHRVTARLIEDGLQFDDDGPGVPVDERVRVFEPLYRGQAARSARIAGHGLGLALIAHVARQHGGTAAFEEGAPGARLSLRFPAAPSPLRA